MTGQQGLCIWDWWRWQLSSSAPWVTVITSRPPKQADRDEVSADVSFCLFLKEHNATFHMSVPIICGSLEHCFFFSQFCLCRTCSVDFIILSFYHNCFEHVMFLSVAKFHSLEFFLCLST